MSTKITTSIAVFVPLVGLAAALWYGCTPLYFALFAVMSIVTGLGVTVGLHRYFTHRSFDTIPLVQAILGAIGGMAIQGPLFWWVAAHRVHHRYSDEGGDPHSPHTFHSVWRGFWHAHIGWMFTYEIEPRDYTKDLRQMPEAATADDMFPFWVIVGLLAPAAVSYLMGGTILGGLLWGGLARWFFVNHVTWSINSICHLWGRHPFDSRDESRNVGWLALPSLGESWHNNHHAFPTSARHGLKWWQIDVSYYVICVLEYFGLAWNVKRPPARLLAKWESPQ